MAAPRIIPEDMVLVRFTRPDRGPQGCFNTGDIAGFAPAVAHKLVTQHYAVLHNAGKGDGKPDYAEITPGREEGESYEAWAERYLRVTRQPAPPQPKKG